jgi:sugar phosphate isomerase/epimerase
VRLGTSIPTDECARTDGSFDLDKALACLRDADIRGCLHNFVGDEAQWEPTARRFQRSLSKAGITLLEYNAPFFIYTPTPEDCMLIAERIVRLLEIAESIGCLNVTTCVAGPRGLYPDPWNRSKECRDLLIRTCSLVAEKAGRLGLRARLLLEPVYTTVIRTPGELAEVIDAVASPNVKAHMDFVNLLSYDNMYDHADFIGAAFDALGGRICSAHLKDAAPMDSYLPAIRELPAGDGIVDLRTYLSHLGQLGPEFPVLIEHLSAMPDIQRCYRHVCGLARELKLETWSE